MNPSLNYHVCRLFPCDIFSSIFLFLPCSWEKVERVGRILAWIELSPFCQSCSCHYLEFLYTCFCLYQTHISFSLYSTLMLQAWNRCIASCLFHLKRGELVLSVISLLFFSSFVSISLTTAKCFSQTWSVHLALKSPLWMDLRGQPYSRTH